MKIFSRTRYYFVSYSHGRGFGNIFFKAKPELLIRDAEKEILSLVKVEKVVIIAFSEISKSQFVEKPVDSTPPAMEGKHE